MARDLPALWRSAEWRAAIEAWLLPALEEAGVRVTGPVVQDRVRFWSTLLHVETDAGRVWVKENAPSQAFEAGLVQVVEEIVPGTCAPLVAVDAARGWFATADLGLPLWHDETPPPPDDWVAVVAGYSAAQHVLANHADAVLAAGVPLFPEDPDDVVAWVTDLLDGLRALPADDPRRPTDEEAALVEDGLDRIHDAAAVLTASGLPSTLQHNDLHLANAFRRPDGGMTYIDLGDSVCGRTRSRRCGSRCGSCATGSPSPRTTPTCAAPATPGSSHGPTASTARTSPPCCPPRTGSRACTAPSRGRASSATCRSGSSTTSSCGLRSSGSSTPPPPTRTPRASPAEPLGGCGPASVTRR